MVVICAFALWGLFCVFVVLCFKFSNSRVALIFLFFGCVLLTNLGFAGRCLC